VREDRSPLYVRLGAIVAMNVENDAAGHGDAGSKGWRTIDIYPGEEASHAAVWDTASFPPRAGVDRTDVSCEPAAGGFAIRLDGGPARDTILRIRAARPLQVTGLPRAAWRYDARDARLWVRLPKARNARVVLAAVN
jgi:hypothetical protein